MKSDTPLDYAAFQLSPKRSRCELFVSRNRNTEKLASGLVKPFVTHLKVVEEQIALAVQSIKLDVERRKNAESWFTKGTLERFVRFVSTPEVLELVNTFDAEMSQLEAARIIYSQGAADQLPSTVGGGRTGSTAAADETKKELLRAINVRLVAVKQDLTASCARAAVAGFNHGTVSDLQLFADRFGANRLNEACSKFLSLYERRQDLFNPWKPGLEDQAVRSSYGSDMSIDDDDPTPTPQDATPQHLLDQPKPNKCQQPKLSSSASFPLRRSTSRESDGAVEKDKDKDKEKKEETDDQADDEPSTQTIISQPAARRLSVQDRIKLFETKQESGGKPAVVGKPAELRRLSSDVSSAPAAVERAVLRRWSGASDMSIDLSGGDKKENDSPLCTPTPSSSSVSQAKTEDPRPFNDTPTSAKPELGKDQYDSPGEEVVTTKVGTSSGRQLTVSSVKLEDSSGSNKSTSTLGKTESWSSLSKAEDDSLKVPATSQTQFIRSFPGGRAERFGSADQLKFKPSLGGDGHGVVNEQVTSETQISGLEEQAGSLSQFGASRSRSGDIRSASKSNQPLTFEFSDPGEHVGSRDESVSQSRSRPPLKTALDLGHLEVESGSKIREAFAAAQHKGSEAGSLPSQTRSKSSAEIEEVGKKDLVSSEKQIGNSGLEKMKFQKQVRRDESVYVYANRKTPFPAKSVAEGSIPITPPEQVQRARQSKGNQELNDELKMKANELEKLFAEHKLRVPGDESNSSRRSKPAEMDTLQAVSLPYGKQVVDTAPTQFPEQNAVVESSGGSSNMSKLTATSATELVDGQGYGDALKQSFSDLGFSEDSRGEFYDSYMQKRDERLREIWGSKRAEKEAQMKTMHDSLERNKTEMKAQLSGSVDRQDSMYSGRRRAERLRSFNTRSTIDREQPLDFGPSEDNEDPSEFSEQKPFGQDKSFGEASCDNGVSRSFQGKKPLPNRTSSTSTPRTSAAPVPRSAVKASSSGRRRMQSKNPLAQPVPNFSDLRKENTKPYSAVGRTTARPQLRNYARNRSTNEEMLPVKEEKPWRSQSLRKSTGIPAEFKDTSPMSSEGVVLTPLKFDKEQTEHSVFTKFPKIVESKPFLRKNNGIGPGAGSGVAKMKASMVSEAVNDEEEYEQLTFEPEHPMDVVKDEEEIEDQVMDDHTESRLSHESERLMNSESENGDASQSFSQVGASLVAELPAAVTSTFHPVGSVQDSPGESPMSWNSCAHHPFSYPNEASDIDASADSPMGSPASWNLHALNQTEADAARMRKKWGSAQKPILVANSSGNQSRMDVTKGFKRLLKFGRKSRGTESLVDWISATTSEGDDDTEDGRDLANRSSEDLRKSRMGYSHGHPSEDSFNESDFFSEQVQALHSSIPAPPANFRLREDHLSGSSIKAPRSFFSLSSFRSKGSDSKPR